MNVDTTYTPIDEYTYVVNLKSLSPASHEIEGLYRVPVKIEDEQHTVYVGDNHTRMFDADTLPDFLKHKLAMIAVRGWGELIDDNALSVLHLFSTIQGDMATVGWRASPSFYIVVMTMGELCSLTGK